MALLRPLLAAACACASLAWAENYNEVFLDDTAAMTGGAVIATGEEAGMAWYNPAGLAALEKDAIQLTASDYGAHYFHLPKFVRLVLPDRSTTMGMEAEAFSSTPSTLVYATRLGQDLTGAFSFLVGRQLDVLATKSEVFPGRAFDGALPYTFEQGIGLDIREKRYRGGLSLGWQASPQWRAGLSVFGEYTRVGYVSTFWGDLRFDGVDAGGGQPARMRSRRDFRIGQSLYGARGVAGLQWKGRRVALGASFASPSFSLYKADDADIYIDLAVNTPVSYALQVHALEKRADHPYVWTDVYRAKAGLAFLYGDSWIAYEAEASDRPDDEGRGTVFNHRLGWKQGLNRNWSAGLGAYTDLGEPQKLDFVIQSRMDFYGATAGLRYWKPLGDSSKPPVEMTTVLAVGYKRGFGDMAGPALDALNYNYFLPPVWVSDATFEEATVHLGGGLFF